MIFGDNLDKKVKKAIFKLTGDDNFQTVFGNDKVLDELQKEYQQLEEIKAKLENRMNRRLNAVALDIDDRACRIIVDYLTKTDIIKEAEQKEVLDKILMKPTEEE